jgi:hypothetical protein
MWRILQCASLAFACVSIIPGASISQNSYLWSHPREPWTVKITVEVFDNFMGDDRKQEWKYTVENISFLTEPDLGDIRHGISVFGLSELLGPNLWGIGDFQAPTGWSDCFGCFLGDELLSAAWVADADVSHELLPGESATFGFTLNRFNRPEWLPTTPNAIITRNRVASVQALIDGRTVAVGFSGTLDVPGPIPEPSGAVLLIGGLSALAFVRRLSCSAEARSS